MMSRNYSVVILAQKSSSHKFPTNPHILKRSHNKAIDFFGGGFLVWLLRIRELVS